MSLVSDTFSEWLQFADWLNQQLEERHLSIRALARKAGISHTVVARMSNAEGTFTVQSLNAIADALSVPREKVQQLAGLLTDHGEALPEVSEWSKRLMALPDELRVATVAAMEASLRASEVGVQSARR